MYNRKNEYKEAVKNMDRMKTFLTYALLIIGFFALSMVLENGLLMAMYTNISGEFDGYYDTTRSEFSSRNMKAKACNVNGYMSFDLINTTGSFIDRCFLKIDLYNEQDLLADTEYVELKGLQPNDVKSFSIKFKANNIETFHISIVENVPDKTNIINILGWEIDLTNVFGLGIDLSNITIFGTKLTDIFNWNHIKNTGRNFWIWLVSFTTSIPWWGYFGGWLFYVGLL